MSFDGYQVAGLKRVAKLIVEQEGVRCEESGERFSDEMYWSEGMAFHKYTFPDGRVLFERIQDDPMIDCYTTLFLALQDKNGEWVPESLWSDGEIKKAECNFYHSKSYEEDGEYWIRDKHGHVRRGVIKGNKFYFGKSEHDLDEAAEIISPYCIGQLAPCQ